MPRGDGTGPYWGGGPRSGLQRGDCLGNYGLGAIPWWAWAMMGVGTLLIIRSYGRKPAWLK